MSCRKGQRHSSDRDINKDSQGLNPKHLYFAILKTSDSTVFDYKCPLACDLLCVTKNLKESWQQD